MKDILFANPPAAGWIKHAYELVPQKPAMFLDTEGAEKFTVRDWAAVDFAEIERRIMANMRATSKYVWVDEWSDYGYRWPFVGEAKFFNDHPCVIPEVEAFHAKHKTDPVARAWEPGPSAGAPREWQRIVVDSFTGFADVYFRKHVLDHTLPVAR